MKNTRLSNSIIIGLSTLLLSSGVHAEAVDSNFSRLDTDGDALISWLEYAAKNPKSGRIDPRRIFDNVDTNRDGYIDTAEFATMKQRRKK